MSTGVYIARKLAYGLSLLLGVTFISFVLMVYLGPDQTYSLLGKNPTQADIDNIRHQLGYDQPFLLRYGRYIAEIAIGDFGYSSSTNERVGAILARTVPVSIAAILPGFLIGNFLAVGLALWATHYRGLWQDKLIMLASVVGMSISLLIVIIGFQMIFCSSYGLDLFPVQGWEIAGLGDYFHYAAVPTMALVFVTLGYNTRFYRAVLVEELECDHVRTARAFGCPPLKLLVKHVLKNGMIPILTRLIFTLPYILMGGSLLIESFFSIPGIGGVTYDAITSGDLPVLKAIVSTSTILYVGVVILIDVLYQWVDPRIALA